MIFCTFRTVNIYKMYFWLVICIAKNFIWNLKSNFLNIRIFFYPKIPDFQIVISLQNIVRSQQAIENLFIQLSDDV